MCGPDPGELSAFLGEHTPFQTMPKGELAELAANSSLVSFDRDEVIADYATHVPDEVWMVCSGHVALQAADGSTIDAVEPGGIDQLAHLDPGAEDARRVVAPLVVGERPLAGQDLREADDHGQRRPQVVAELCHPVGAVVRHACPAPRRRAAR